MKGDYTMTKKEMIEVIKNKCEEEFETLLFYEESFGEDDIIVKKQRARWATVDDIMRALGIER